MARSTPSAPPGRSNITTPITAPSKSQDEDHRARGRLSERHHIKILMVIIFSVRL